MEARPDVMGWRATQSHNVPEFPSGWTESSAYTRDRRQVRGSSGLRVVINCAYPGDLERVLACVTQSERVGIGISRGSSTGGCPRKSMNRAWIAFAQEPWIAWSLCHFIVCM